MKKLSVFLIFSVKQKSREEFPRGFFYHVRKYLTGYEVGQVSCLGLEPA